MTKCDRITGEWLYQISDDNDPGEGFAAFYTEGGGAPNGMTLTVVEVDDLECPPDEEWWTAIVYPTRVDGDSVQLPRVLKTREDLMRLLRLFGWHGKTDDDNPTEDRPLDRICDHNPQMGEP
jgi:hypothetical protein